MTQAPDEQLWDLLPEVQGAAPGEILGDIHKAAQVGEVKPGTIRVWMSRGKLRPLFGDPGQEVFHLPTVKAVAEAGRAKNIPPDPAANARGPHRRAA